MVQANFELCELEIGVRRLGIEFDGLLEVSLGFVKLFAAGSCDASVDIRRSILWRHRYNRVCYLCQKGKVVLCNGYICQTILSLNASGIESNSIPIALLCGVQVPLTDRSACEEQLKLKIIWVVLGRILKGSECICRFTIVKL